MYMLYNCNLSTYKAEAGGSQVLGQLCQACHFQGKPELHTETLSQNNNKTCLKGLPVPGLSEVWQ